MQRKIQQIIQAKRVNMGGIFLDQALPIDKIEQLDPFLLIHHWKNTFPGDQDQKNLGVGPHPHRGFSPVTLIFKGEVHHRDSRGNNEVISTGGTQWMNSGMGIIHSERPSDELAERGGEFEIIQFWVNSPSWKKMKQPDYQSLSEGSTTKIESSDGKTLIGVIAGNYQNNEGKIKVVTPLQILRLDMQKGAKLDLKIPANYNSLLYQLDGRLLVNSEHETYKKDMICFENEALDSTVKIEAMEDTRAISLSGLPIDEKVTSHGPFVMNTDTEILEAMRDYQMGKMGVLIEEFK